MFRTLLLLLISTVSTHAFAVTCINGCNENIYTSLSGQLTASENKVGATKDSSSISLSNRATLVWSAGQGQTWATYSDGLIPAANTIGSTWNFAKIDDYISVAFRMRNNCRTLYAPYNAPTLDSGCNVRSYTDGQQLLVSPRTYETKIRIDKGIISGTYAKNVYVGEFGFCQPMNCSTKQVILNRLYLNVSFSVPQSCEINSGQVIKVDFGNIPSSSFKVPGKKADGVNSVSRNLSIKCDNMDASANLTMRLQADNVQGNAIVSNNKDVGFVVANSDGSELTPNDLSSFIPFKLNGSFNSNVNINVYPVSITGLTPAEGMVSSSGLLRVDFP